MSNIVIKAHKQGYFNSYYVLLLLYLEGYPDR